MTKEAIINEIDETLSKGRELFDIAFEYNMSDKTRSELSQKCTSYLVGMLQTLGAIKDEKERELNELSR